MTHTDRLAAIAARVEKATPGPWLVGDERLPTLFPRDDPSYHIALLESVREPRFRPNADFIAHAREDIPFLLAQLAAQQETITALRAQIVELSGIAKGRLEGAEIARAANERNNP